MSQNLEDWTRYQTLREEFFAADADAVVSHELEMLILEDRDKKRDFVEHLQFRAWLSIDADRIKDPSFDSGMMASVSANQAFVGGRKTIRVVLGLGALAATIWFLAMAMRAPVVGSQLTAGRLVLESGVASLAFPDVEITLEGPVELELVSQSHCKLVAGRIFVRSKMNSGGLKLELPNAIIFDRGAEFGINVTDRSGAELLVMAGRVEVTHRGISETIDADDTDNYRFFVDGPETPEVRRRSLTAIDLLRSTGSARRPI